MAQLHLPFNSFKCKHTSNWANINQVNEKYQLIAMQKFHRRHAIKPHKSLRLFHFGSASMRCALFCHWIICHHILEGAVPCLSAQTSIISWCRMELYFFHGWPSLKNGRFLPLAMSIYPNEWVGCFAFEQL